MKQLAVDWTKHLRDPEEKKNFEDLVRNSTQVLSRLKDVLKERQDTINAAEYSISDFDTPNWENRQAFRNGGRSAYRDIDRLLSFLGG